MDHFKKYGFNHLQISTFLLGCDISIVREKVILAPCWEPQSVGIECAQIICNHPNKVWDCTMDEKHFTFINSGIGASSCSDAVMSLKESACRQILFLGSAGGINMQINIGDLAIPNCVMCGDGVCRFISDDIRQDSFGEEYYPSFEMQRHILNAVEAKIMLSPGLPVKCHTGKSTSVESIYFQFQHLESFQKLNCSFLEMEGAAFLKSAGIAGKDAAIVFCISDNAVLGQSLITVSKENTCFRKNIRRILMPTVISSFLSF